MDRASRFVIAWTSGPRTETLAETVIGHTRARTAGQAGTTWLSDGWAPYADTVLHAYLDPDPASTATDPPRFVRLTLAPGTQLTQTIKRRRGRRLVRVEVRTTLGEAVAQPHPVHIERLNGVLRDRLAGLTRKTHAFAKSATTWDATVGLALFLHNWTATPKALRQPLAQPSGQHRYHYRTPAMVMGLTDHVWSLTEFLTHPVHHWQ